LVELWQQEKLAVRRQTHELREALPFRQRVERGLALANLRYENTEAGGGQHLNLWFELERPGALEAAQIHVGDPVVLWTSEQPLRQAGVVGRRGQTRISIVVDPEYASFVEQDGVHLDLEADETTFERGEVALQRFLSDSKLTPLRELFFGEAEPTFGSRSEVTLKDQRLNPTQRDAVSLALAAEQVALIHGPPGTGKTRTLVEVVRQHLGLGRSILVTAASNTAVDHLTRQLVAQGVKPLRLGHPTRVAEDLRPRTLETQMQATEEYQLAREWQNEARALREKFHKAKTRPAKSGQSRDWMIRANRLNADARRSLKEARAKVLRRARVVCTTAAGADSKLLGNDPYDVVVLDEATQAPDPVALAALLRGKRAVLAGDPCQLPPTIVDPEAARAGLSSTLFERASRRWNSEATHLLTVQYRMHAVLMRFPSESMYHGKLEADESVADRTLEALPGVAPDPTRQAPWALVDTSGTGWDEAVEPESLSTFNAEHAERTAQEVRRLLARGVPARDVAAITPYGAQVRLLRRLLADAVRAGLEIGTVDGFQGREKEAIVVDLVRSNAEGALGFLNDIRRTNVALTRAKRCLVVVCDGSTLANHPYYRALLARAEADGVWETCFDG
jgi:superfamily I DNA and/or RNA helicase